jgi:DNA-binding CsgD family transcriptional regulator
MMHRFAGRWFLGGFAVFAVVVLAGLDQLTGDEPLSAADFLLDVLDKGLLVGTVLVIVTLSGEMRGLKAEHETIRGDLRTAIAAGEAWRELSRTHIEGLSAAIARQFDAWKLSNAEAEIAGLMLKGMSLREIAAARRTSDTTIRQQAAGIYRKSGLSGRAELSAYFLDSLSPVPALRAAE